MIMYVICVCIYIYIYTNDNDTTNNNNDNDDDNIQAASQTDVAETLCGRPSLSQPSKLLI